MDVKRPEIRGLAKEELSNFLVKTQEKAFRGNQIFSWIQDKSVQSWEEMKNLSRALQQQLAQNFTLLPLKLLLERVSRDGTRKYLWALPDGSKIESVLLYHGGDITRKRTTLCLSTQVGCPMACSFCATGKLGFTRNLTVGEIVSQVLDITAFLRKNAEFGDKEFKINNLVYMGMGEPLLNLPAVLKSIKLLNHEEGQNIGKRRITVSTCGLVPQIEQLAVEEPEIVLAVSLHAPNDELRNQIMPVNRKYPLAKLMKACCSYVDKTGRRLTFEYALVKGFNDGMREAVQLAHLLKGIKANVNVIPVNNTAAQQFRKPLGGDIKKFVHTLRELGINAVIREEKGSDIEAACGQLAGRSEVR